MRKGVRATISGQSGNENEQLDGDVPVRPARQDEQALRPCAAYNLRAPEPLRGCATLPMPIYEYRCGACRRRVSLFYQTFSAAEAATPVCSHCGSTELTRLVSRVFQAKSEDARLDDLADPSSFGDLDENDPRSVARWARKLGSEMGEDLGEDWEEMVDQLEAGEDLSELDDAGRAGSGDEAEDELASAPAPAGGL